MKTNRLLGVMLAISSAAWAADPFKEGCGEAATEVLCGGQKDCQVPTIMAGSKTGNDSKRGGREECKEFAMFAKSQGISVGTKQAIVRMKKKLEALNQQLKKDFPNIVVTADFSRLELEEVVENALHMDHYGRDSRVRGCAEAYASSDTSQEFEYRYLHHIKTALNNLLDDEVGKGQLGKISEIKIAFFSYGKTSADPDAKMKMVGKTLVVPGNSKCDTGTYSADAYVKFISQL